MGGPPLGKNSKKIKLPRIIPEKMLEEERQYIWRNRKGKVIYTPIYEIYRDTFFQPVIDNTEIKAVFKRFGKTGQYERDMLNGAQFAAAKEVHQNELLLKVAEMLDDDGKLISYPKYEKEARMITSFSADSWLRVEYDEARRNAVMGDSFRRLEEDADLYPYWQYRGVMDDRERDEHVALEGAVFRIGDPEGDDCYPPNDWNCRCTAEPVDDEFLQNNNLQAKTTAQAAELKNKYVDEQFRYNPAKQGPLPNTGSYFDIMPSANAGNYRLFNLQPARDMGEGSGIEGFAAKGMHYVVNIIEGWRRDYHVDEKTGDIVFQNKALFANVRFTGTSMHALQKHWRGFENLPATVQEPDEVWGTWEDETQQQVVLRVYIKFGKTCYLVFTKDGTITDAYALSPNAADKYRVGCIL